MCTDAERGQKYVGSESLKFQEKLMKLLGLPQTTGPSHALLDCPLPKAKVPAWAGWNAPTNISLRYRRIIGSSLRRPATGYGTAVGVGLLELLVSSWSRTELEIAGRPEAKFDHAKIVWWSGCRCGW